jgi:dUTP pyrophosphatase
MLKAKLLSSDARIPTIGKVPTVGHPGEDLAYDIYANENVYLQPMSVHKIKTGVAAVFDGPPLGTAFATFVVKWGLLIRDRGSMSGDNHLFVIGGVVDAGYRGEISVVMVNFNNFIFEVKVGDKIAQMIPMPVLTGWGTTVVDELPASSRGEGAWGSTGR